MQELSIREAAEILWQNHKEGKKKGFTWEGPEGTQKRVVEGGEQRLLFEARSRILDEIKKREGHRLPKVPANKIGDFFVGKIRTYNLLPMWRVKGLSDPRKRAPVGKPSSEKPSGRIANKQYLDLIRQMEKTSPGDHKKKQGTQPNKPIPEKKAPKKKPLWQRLFRRKP